VTETLKERLERLWAPTLSREDVMPTDASLVSDLVEDDSPMGPPVDDDGEPTGVMVALYPEPVIAQQLAVEGGEPVDEIHMTMAYLGNTSDVGDRADELLQLVQDWASTQPALTGEVAGFGRFTAGPTPVTYASVDLPGLPAMRQSLVDVLERAGFNVPQEHGFTPHMTLAYSDADVTVPNLPLRFDACVVAYGGVYVGIPFGNPVEPAKPDTGDTTVVPDTARLHITEPAPLMFPNLSTGGFISTTSPFIATTNGPIAGTHFVGGSWLVPVPPTAAQPEAARAFVTEEAGRTLVTAPATTWERALSPNRHMTWMQGRFVGAEKANRNNAFWSSGDLELGQATVAHGPLNWLHEARHVIGTIADARYIPAKSGDLTTADAGPSEPHIIAASAIWKWIYPDEAWVVEQASEAQKLWYSMECVSDSVACVGEGSCGKEVAYDTYVSGGGCMHMMERATTRRFVNPTFLGGAVIVPPVRPGWADADASVMKQAANLAEKSFDQAGHPDITASDWELLMAQVVGYARS
jgi:hypothetical protein